MLRIDFVVNTDGRVNVSQTHSLADDRQKEESDGGAPEHMAHHFHLEFPSTRSASHVLAVLEVLHNLELHGGPQEDGQTGVEQLVSAIIKAQLQQSD